MEREKAQLALARLLYHDSPLILLDEPSASLDPVGEREIFSFLSALAKEKIILFTTHRYDTIRRASTIMVLVDGKIAEVGTRESWRELQRNEDHRCLTDECGPEISSRHCQSVKTTSSRFGHRA